MKQGADRQCNRDQSAFAGAGSHAGPNDRATLEEDTLWNCITRDRERKLLQKIDQAVARIDHGEYGYCEDTGEPGGLQRQWHADNNVEPGSTGTASE